VIGVTGGFITNAVYDLLHLHLGMGPVTSTTIAMVPVSLHDPSLGLDRSLSGLTGAAAMTITPPAGGSPAA